ncbi:putative type VI secretion system effector [Xanthomonas oryzae]|uniref:putative type VI secretion system effector n=1 Tax=Xanthomonas oryzae TaxID=347 RepID=UPI0030FE29D6
MEMSESSEFQAQVLSGKLSNVKLKNTTAEVFFRQSDAEGIATTGVVAAALGLSGAAAGMVAMSLDETKEPVCQVSFDLGDKHVEGMLWNWPFKEGDEVQVVVEPALNGGYICFAVLDPKDKIISLYPHVSAGGKAHWRGVFKLSAKASIFIAAVAYFLMVCLTFFAVGMRGDEFVRFIFFLLLPVSLSALIFFVIGCRIGRRFTPFVEMAEPIFTLLGWKDVKNINLRKITEAKKKPTDPSAMGDSYFRY